MSRSRILALLVAGLVLLAGLAVLPVARGAHATSACPGATLYSAMSGPESAGPLWEFSGVAGPIGNGYTGVLYLDTWNPDPLNAIHVEWFAYSEVSTLSQDLAIFNWPLDLPPGRSKTQTYDGTIGPFANVSGDPTVVPSGKVHFAARGYTPLGPTAPQPAPVSVHAEQWLTC